MEIIEEISNLVQNANLDDAANSGINKLFQENKIQPEFHITLSHISQRKKGTELQRATWQNLIHRYQNLISTINVQKEERHCLSTKDVVKFTIRKLCWDEKIVGILVDLPEEHLFDAGGEAVPKINLRNEVSHITVGILETGTPPFTQMNYVEKCYRPTRKETITS